MNQDKRIIWSLESSIKAEEISSRLHLHWSAKEVDVFYSRLKRFELLVCKYPLLYPKSLSHSKFRKAVISKHNSIIYEVDSDCIRVHTILDNRQENN